LSGQLATGGEDIAAAAGPDDGCIVVFQEHLLEGCHRLLGGSLEFGSGEFIKKDQIQLAMEVFQEEGNLLRILRIVVDPGHINLFFTPVSFAVFPR